MGDVEHVPVHVLLVTLSAQGHINPMLMFAKVLVSKGLHVTLATEEASRKRILEANSSASANPNFDWEFFSDGLPDDFDRNHDIEPHFESLFKHGPRSVSDMIKNVSNVWKFSCLIYNPFVPWVVNVAVKHDIPCAMLWIQPCALFAIYYHFYNDLSPFPTLESPDILIELPGIPCLGIKQMPSFFHPSNPFPVFMKLLMGMIKDLDKVKWVLGTSFYELEKDTVVGMEKFKPITPIGPLVPPALLGKEEVVTGSADKWKVDNSCLEWLSSKSQSSVIYISFGSFLVLNAKQMENIALALKKTNKPFLWVVKPAENSAEDGKGLIEEITLGRGLVVKWCPQTKVLTHPSIACFMSHCGWNSMLEAIVAGVPVLALPEWTDQPANAKLLTEVFKMGVELEKGEDQIISQEELERGILEVTQGAKAEEWKKNAVQWREAAKNAVAVGGSSDKNLDMFIDDIKAF